MVVSDVRGADFCGYNSHLSISNSDKFAFERFYKRWNQKVRSCFGHIFGYLHGGVLQNLKN